MLDDLSQARWRKLETILDAALELDPASRLAYLAMACRDDVGLQAEAERLLHSCDKAEGLFPGAAAAAFEALLRGPEVEEIPEERIGPYRVLAEAGRGGMGMVYAAERADDQYRKRVALKLLRHGLDDPHLVRRFIEERQILAALDHPHIAKLLDGGVTAGGLPWFAMEYVDGEPIDRYCDRRCLTTDQRLRLFLAVCDAVQYAHRNLVVHRDLKPSNILVAVEGEVKLLDFGVAKLLAGAEAPETTLTRAGWHAMTPEYASPEQMRGEPVTVASDVYSLGVVLYRLLVGQRPYGLKSQTPAELERAVLEQQSEPPSSAGARGGTEAAAARGTTPDRLRRRLRGDLDMVVLTALRKEPERRYSSADRLGADIRRHLEGLPVSAGPDRWSYRAGKFVRRHPVGVIAAIGFVLLLAGSSVLSTVQSARTARERDKAEGLAGFLVDLLGASNPYEGRGETVTVRELLDSAVPRIERELHREPEIRAELLAVMGRAYEAMDLLERARLLLDSAVAIRRRSGNEDFDLIRDQSWLARVSWFQGHHFFAESLYRATLRTSRRRFGDRHPSSTLPLMWLGNALRQDGRWAEAESLLTQAVAIQRTQPRDSAGTLAEAIHMLAHLFEDRDDLAEAEPLLREAIALRTVALGAEHPQTGDLYADLGRVLHKRKDPAAEWFLRRGLDLKPASSGAGDMLYLSGVLAGRGDMAAAESLAQATLVMLRQLTPEGWGVASALVTLGRIRLARGDPAGAERLLREGLSMTEKFVPGKFHHAEAKRLLGVALATQGRYAEAEPHLLAGAELLGETIGTQDTLAFQVLRDVIALYETWGRPERAREFRQRLERAGASQ